jgi:hypothetical protein
VLLGSSRDDSAEAKLNKLQSLLAQSSGNLPRDMPLFAALLSISGGARYPLPEMTPQRRKAAQFMYRNATGENRKARETAERCRTLATRQGNPTMQLSTHYVMGMSLRQHGEFAAAQNEFEKLLALCDPRSGQSHASLAVTSTAELALVLWILGYPERAAKMQAQAFRRAAELNNVLATGSVRVNAGVRLEQLFGNVAAVLVHAEAWPP